MYIKVNVIKQQYFTLHVNDRYFQNKFSDFRQLKLTI